MDNTSYKVISPNIVSEVIDGELIIMDLSSGRYYSSDNSGAVLWAWIEKGYCKKDLISLLFSHYIKVSDDVEQKLNQFIVQLIQNDLIQEKDVIESGLSLPAPPENLPQFTDPTLNVYTDMKDMLLLDPIHDVDDAGWPSPKAIAD